MIFNVVDQTQLNDVNAKVNDIDDRVEAIENGLLVVETKQSANFNLTANGTSEQIINITKAGYTPLGIIGYRGFQDTRYYPYRFNVDSGGAKVSLKNTISSALNNLYIQVQILYVKTLQ